MASPIQPYLEHDWPVGVRLCEFATASAVLREAHKHFLSTYFIPMMKENPHAWVDLIGSASRKGKSDANKALSNRRIAAVEEYLTRGYPKIKINVRIAEGAENAESFRMEASNDEGFFRAVLIRFYGVPRKIETPVYPDEEAPKLKKRKLVAPKGCWCVIGVESFGVPVKFASAGKVDVTLLNDQGEKWVLHGAGGGVGLGVEIGKDTVETITNKILGEGIGQKIGETIVTTFKELGIKAVDLQNISKTIKDLNLTGPSETNGGVLKGTTWAANLTMDDITGGGGFSIVSGEFHMVVGGVEQGFIFFGNQLLPVPVRLALGNPWAFYAGAGMNTL